MESELLLQYYVESFPLQKVMPIGRFSVFGVNMRGVLKQPVRGMKRNQP